MFEKIEYITNYHEMITNILSKTFLYISIINFL